MSSDTEKFVQITEKEFKQFQVLKKIIQHEMFADSGHYFICGESEQKDLDGLPTLILICPTYGVTGHATYIKKQDFVGNLY